MRTVGRGLASLSEADLDFLVRAVTETRTDYDHIKDLVRGKADLLQVMVDDERVFQRLTESPEALVRVSPYLLFTVLLRRAQRDLRTRGFTMEVSAQGTLPVFDAEAAARLLEDDAVRDYLASMLAEFTRIERRTVELWDRRGPRRVSYSTFAVEEMEALVEQTEEAQRFPLYRRLGDLCLFLTGMFADHLARRAREATGRAVRQRRPGPAGIEAYEELGRTYYRRAAEADSAAQLGLAELLARLADDFTLARKPLTVIAQSYIPMQRHQWFAGPAPAR
ncbi:MAG: hypothetical protein LOD91_04165 [Limnochordales bacterium]|nr:hypothetical protein [Limnochordales bacterium]